MKRLFLLFLFLAAAIFVQAQNSKVSGTVFDSETGKTVKGAKVKIGSIEATTDDNGVFELKNVPVGKNSVMITIDGYDSQSSAIDVIATETKLGAFNMKHSSFYNSENSGISEVSLSTMDFEDENKGQNISGLLHSTSDVFTNTAGYTLGAAYFRIRGFDSENANVYISGVYMNDPENGRPAWSEWGGLNDALRNKEVISGIGASRFSFGAPGGSTNIITRPTLQRKQNKLSYALSNKSYVHRVMYTYSTGLLENNWAFTISGSRRWGNEGYVTGVFYDAYAYFMAAEKKLNDKHSLALTVFGSPTKRGMQAASTQECYNLLDNNYYNPNWGYQNGEVRNAKVKNFHEPMFILNDFLTLNPKMKITNSLAYSYGKNATSSLNWYNAPDPRPDYYRYLPSYQFTGDPSVTPDQNLVDAITEDWETNNTDVTQINWDHLYQINYLANQTGAQANYVVEDRRNDHSQIMLNSLLNYQKSDNLIISGGMELSKYTGFHFKTINDMLGGNYWMDIDQFALTDFPSNPDAMQNDLNDPNREVKEGDRYGYDYNIYQNDALAWGQAEYSFNKVEFYGAANLSYTSFWRKGNMKNGRDPENSYGNSEKSNYFNYGIKAGGTYKINGHNYTVGNIMYMTRAPFAKNAFVSPDIKNTMVDGITSETILSGDISYIFKTPKISVRATAYESIMTGGSKVITYYHDDYKTFVNMTMTGIDKVLQGFELGTEVKASTTVSIIGVAALGNYRYTSRPTAIVSLENMARPDVTETIYQKNFYVSGTPQNAFSIGAKYAHPKYWYFNLNLNYFDKMYLDFNPERRTETAIFMMGEGDTTISYITKQQKLDGGFTLDASLGKSIRYKKYFININLSVSNILNNLDLITNGYEQMRFDFENNNVNKFPPKYFYMFGRTFFLNASIRI